MTPEQIAAFRASLTPSISGSVPQYAPAAGEQLHHYSPDPTGPSGPTPDGADRPLTMREEMIHRARDYGGAFAANPAVRGLAAVGNPSAGMLGGAVDYATERMGIGRRTGETMREMEGGPQPVELRPMASGPSADVQAVPTLDPNYGRGPARSMGGGVANAGGGMGQLARDYRQAQLNQFGTFNTHKDLLEHRGELQAERAEQMAQAEDLDAARKMRDAEVKAKADAAAAKKHEDFLTRHQQLVDEIGSEKIDPQAVINQMSTGQKIGFAIAGLLSGAAGQGAQAMAQLNNHIEMGVKAQIANSDNKKAKVSARASIFDRMMAESGDRKVAEAQTRVLIDTAVKQKIMAQAERLGIPEMKVNAELARNELDEKKINPLQVQMTGDALRSAQAQAAAAAAAQRAAEEKAYQRMKDEREYGLKLGHLGVEMDKAGTEKDSAKHSLMGRFVATGQDGDKNPTGYLARNEVEAAKAEKKRIANEKLLGLVDEALKVRADQGVSGRLGTALNPVRAVGYTPEWQTKLNVLQGKMTGAIKDAEELGTLDAGSQAFADKLTGGEDLKGVGGKADDSLRAFRQTLVAGNKADEGGAAGARATRFIDPRTGKERVEITGGADAPRPAMPTTRKR